ncbi:MAG: histidine--tRNA ligase [Elusimicrobia bacterium]|nr:histidine--tRNA ligase [Candidatus Obscuribacterium magneticum]
MDFLIIQAPKGTRDLAGADVQEFSRLEEIARHVFALFDFQEIRTPIFEAAELFSRSLGETTDVVEKEMFQFEDRGERVYALRPEGTAGVVRYFVENNLAVKGDHHRFYYQGPMFRAERPQAGRYRQFLQIGSELFGPLEATADADTVLLLCEILQRYGVGDFSLHVNSLGCKACRPKHREQLLAYLKKREKELTEDSRRRMAANPLRVLDSKVDGPKLKDAPAMRDFLCPECAAHNRQCLSLVRLAGVPIEENPKLVRGLDYYTRTVFEIVSPHLGAQNALAAGGRYDDLVELLGGPSMPAVGFALGEDRVVESHLKVKAASAALGPVKGKAFVIAMLEEAVDDVFSLAQALRKAGFSVPPILSAKKKLKNQLSLASDFGAAWALIVGEDELKNKTVSVKNLKTREQVAVPKDDVIHHLLK